MLKKVSILLLVLMSISIHSFAYEKANDKYAKQAKVICLNAEGSSTIDSRKIEKEVAIFIIGFKTDKWIISIASDDGVIVTGIFNIKIAHDNGKDLWFQGQGINTVTGEELEFSLSSDNAFLILSFDSMITDQTVKLPLNFFHVHKNFSATSVFINDYISTDIEDIGWKTCSLKQLKKCLSQNPYLQKF